MENQPPQPVVPVLPPQPKKSKLKIILIIVGGMVLLGALIGAAFIFLQPKKEVSKDEQVAPLLETATPEEIVAKYKAATIPERNAAYEEIVSSASSTQTDVSSISNEPSNNVISYYSASTYGTDISAKDTVQYTYIGSDANDHKKLDDATKAFLIEQKFALTHSATVTEGVTFDTYDSTTTICQTSRISVDNDTADTYGLACVSKALVQEQYKTIASLLEKANDVAVADIKNTRISLPIRDEQAKLSLVSLTVTFDDSAEILYFASQNDAALTYIGKRPVPNVDDESSFAPSAQLERSIRDKKWGDFLKTYIK